MKKRFRRAHAEAGNQARVRRPLTSVDRAGLDVSPAAESLVTVRGEMRECARRLMLKEGRRGLLRERGAAGTGKEEGNGCGGDPFQRGRRKPGEKGAVAVRTKRTGKVGGGLEGNVVDLLVELVGYYRKIIPWGKNAPLKAYRERGKVVWTRGQATFCLRSGLERIRRNAGSKRGGQ